MRHRISRLALPILGLAMAACAPAARAGVVSILDTAVNPANGHIYYLISKQTWTSAETEAQGLGGHLVTINDAAENQFIVDRFILTGHAGDPMWIGINDQSVEGTFAWSSGQPVTFTNWYTGEPNNAGAGEDYGAINWIFAGGFSTDHGVWNDTPVAGTTGFPGTTNGPYLAVVEVLPEPTGDLALLPVALALVRTRRHGPRAARVA